MERNWLDNKISILNQDGTYLYVGTGLNRTSFLTVDQVKKIFNIEIGQRIVRRVKLKKVQELYIEDL